MCKIATHLKTLLGFLLFLSTSSLISQEITAPVLDIENAACATSLARSFEINYTFSSVFFDDNNNFIIEMSNLDGEFIDGEIREVATLFNNDYNTDFLGSIEKRFSLPKDIQGGSYKFRIRSTSPEVVGLASDFYEIHYLPEITIAINEFDTNIFLCNGAATTLGFEVFWFDDLEASPSDYTYALFKGLQFVEMLTVNSEGLGSFIVDEVGEYSLKLFAGDFCTDVSPESVINVSSLNVDDVFIQGEGLVQICANETYEFIAGVNDSDYIYKWYKDGEIIQEGEESTYTTTDSGQFGTYQLEVQVGNCITLSNEVVLEQKTTADFTITINTESNVTQVDDKLSILALPYIAVDLVAEVSSQVPDLQYEWYRDGERAFSTSNDISILEEGVYYLEVIDNSSSDCPVSVISEEYHIIYPSSISPVIIVDTGYEECESTFTSLRVQEVKALGSDGLEYVLTQEQMNTFEFEWYKDSDAIADSNIQVYELNSVEDNGVYSLLMVGGEGFRQVSGVSNDLEVTLRADTIITSSSNSNNLCPGSSINLSINTYEGVVYSWYKDDELITVLDVSSVDVEEIGVYHVVYENDGCVNVSDSIEILEFDASVLEVSPSTTAVLIPGEVLLLEASGANTYEWLDEERNSLSSTSDLEVITVGTYILVGSIDGCVAEREILVVEDDGSLIVPNIISPFNGDGANDTWKIPNRLSYQPTVRVILYSFKGKEIYNTTDYQNDWPIDLSQVRGGMIFYYKILNEETLIKAGTISVLE